MGLSLGIRLALGANQGLGGAPAGYGLLKIGGKTLRIDGRRVIIPVGANNG